MPDLTGLDNKVLASKIKAMWQTEPCNILLTPNVIEDENGNKAWDKQSVQMHVSGIALTKQGAALIWNILEHAQIHLEHTYLKP